MEIKPIKHTKYQYNEFTLYGEFKLQTKENYNP